MLSIKGMLFFVRLQTMVKLLGKTKSKEYIYIFFRCVSKIYFFVTPPISGRRPRKESEPENEAFTVPMNYPDF